MERPGIEEAALSRKKVEIVYRMARHGLDERGFVEDEQREIKEFFEVGANNIYFKEEVGLRKKLAEKLNQTLRGSTNFYDTYLRTAVRRSVPHIILDQETENSLVEAAKESALDPHKAETNSYTKPELDMLQHLDDAFATDIVFESSEPDTAEVIEKNWVEVSRETKAAFSLFQRKNYKEGLKKYRAAVRALAKGVIIRNQCIAEELKKLVAEALEEENPTRIYVRIGFTHAAPLVDLYNAFAKNPDVKICASSNYRESAPISVLRKTLLEQVPDTFEWQKAALAELIVGFTVTLGKANRTEAEELAEDFIGSLNQQETERVLRRATPAYLDSLTSELVK